MSNRAEVVFGVKLARHLSVYVLGSFAVLIISFVYVYELTRLLDRGEFGALSLLVFWASLLTLIFNLGSMQGTMRVVFGSTGDDDVEDDAEDIDPDEVRYAMGTGLLLTTLICLAGMAIVWPLSGPLAGVVLGDSTKGNWILLAAATGALGALLRLVSNVLRFERRPVAWAMANVLRPVLVLGPVIYLVKRDGGVGGAIAGTAIGTGLAFALVLLLTRRTYAFHFNAETAKTIMRKGSVVIPVVAALWIVQNVDVFMLSRYVKHHELAPYRVAAQFGLAVTYSTSAFFRAWQPLRRTTASAAVESRFGEDTMRSAMVTYFVLMSLTMLIGLTVAANTFALVAPRNYSKLPLLIPLVAGGFFMHGAFAMIYRASNFRRKYNYYAAASILSAAGFIAGVVIFVPWLHTVGAALAVIMGFSVGLATMLWFSQRRESPIPFQHRSLAGAFALAALCILAGRAAGAAPGRWQFAVATAAALAFIVLCLVTGVIPRGHQAPLFNVVRSLARLRAGHIDPERALAGLTPDDREILRLAVVHRHTPGQIAQQLGREVSDVHAHLVTALRGLLAESEATDHDSKIGHYLFYRESVAQQDALRKRLWNEGAHPEDVRELEATLELLDRAPRHAWSD
jgi:O-antigen/teichoic acid export membrane protein/DNA-binding CsgD family transcriptional regulator